MLYFHTEVKRTCYSIPKSNVSFKKAVYSSKCVTVFLKSDVCLQSLRTFGKTQYKCWPAQKTFSSTEILSKNASPIFFSSVSCQVSFLDHQSTKESRTCNYLLWPKKSTPAQCYSTHKFRALVCGGGATGGKGVEKQPIILMLVCGTKIMCTFGHITFF